MKHNLVKFFYFLYSRNDSSKIRVSIPFSQIVSWQLAQSCACHPVLLASLVTAEHWKLLFVGCPSCQLVKFKLAPFCQYHLESVSDLLKPSHVALEILSVKKFDVSLLVICNSLEFLVCEVQIFFASLNDAQPLALLKHFPPWKKPPLSQSSKQ